MTKLAEAIAKMEGFGLPDALPTRSDNPGDLRHGPGEMHPGDPNAVGDFLTVQDGWDALERQLRIYAERGMTVRQAIYAFAPAVENNSERYLKFVCDSLGCTPGTFVSEALTL